MVLILVVFFAKRRFLTFFKHQQGKDAVSYAKKFGDVINTDAAKNVAASGAEDVILGLMLLYAEHRNAVVNGKVSVSKDDFFTSFGKRVFEYICDLEQSDDGYSRAALSQFFTADEQGRLQRLEQMRVELSDNSLAVLEQAVVSLKNAKQRQDADDSGDKLAAIRLKRQNNKNKK